MSISNFVVRVSITHNQFELHLLSRNGTVSFSNFMVWVSITHDCIYYLITHIAIQHKKKYINSTTYILSFHGKNTNLSIKYLLK